MICSFVLYLIFRRWQPVGNLEWLGFAWLGIVVNAVAYLLWAISLKKAEDSAKTANLAYLVPFISIIISWLVLREKITVNAVFALILIIGGISLQSVNIKRQNNRKENGGKQI
ncbi:MAG: DMT family transporter [Clostridia bacterium]|nr:DMT family transporter [Clostridia bacterium]